MRFSILVAIVVFVCMLLLAGPAQGKGGKGNGGGGRAHASKGGGGSNAHGSGQGGAKHQHAQSKHVGKPDKVANGKPDKEKLAKEHAAKAKEHAAKEKKEKKVYDKIAKDKESRHDDADVDVDDPVTDTDGSDDDTLHNKKEKQLANFQRQRDKKLAQAEHLREIAERNGNANLAANADRMEAQAYEQYARKVSHLEKFGVTDPALDLDGDGFADPYWPHVDPLDDPLGEELLGSERRRLERRGLHLLQDSLLDDPLGTVQSLLPLRR